MTKLVGRYQIQQRIGQGAMANVYRAYDPGIKRVLAIKVLKREYCRNPEFTSRFLREARAAGALSHPNIVTIFDVGEIQGFPYIVMELLDGEPLDRALQRRGAFAAANAVAIGLQVADALRYAHGQGVVHRDIKPSNIMLGRDGRSVKLLDFGIARLEGAEAEPEGEALKTQLGQVVGTPRYMSPEQALGRPLDGRSDLFSVGAVLYELITGKPAFNGSSAATLALQITQAEPEPIDLATACPRGLRFIIEKLLAKRPDKRFANGAALVDALQRERAGLEAASESGRRRLSLPLRAGLVISAITAAVLTFGVGAVLDGQYKAMERVAIASGSSIVSFVASNAALPAAENAVLAPHERDWLPVQAFINTASADANITQMMVADHDGVIQAASDPELVGARYLAPRGRRIVREGRTVSVTSFRSSDGEESFRFVQPISYAGRDVGFVDVSVAKTELKAAAGVSALMLGGLGLLTIAMVAALSIGAARMAMAPLRRLGLALRDAASGDFDFRISHDRRDEFGDLFDAFNKLMDALRPQAAASAPVLNLDATMIAPPPAAANEHGEAPAAERGLA